MDVKKETHGTLTIQNEDHSERKIAIIDFLQGTYKDNRVISVAKTEEDSYVITVENPASSGRVSSVSMHLSKESLMGVVATIGLFLECDGSDMKEMLRQSIVADMVTYKSTFDVEPIESFEEEKGGEQ